MRLVSLAAPALLVLCPAYGESALSGVWALNAAKSSLGPFVAPKQFLLRLERVGSRLATWRVTSGPDGSHLVYREYTLEGEHRSLTTLTRSRTVSILFPVGSTGEAQAKEFWRVSPKRLVIRRSVNDGPRTFHQKLVFEPSKPGPETSTRGID